LSRRRRTPEVRTLHVDVSRADLDRDGKLNIEGHLGGYEQEAEQGFDAARPCPHHHRQIRCINPARWCTCARWCATVRGPCTGGCQGSRRIQAPSAGIVYESNPPPRRFGVAHADWTIPGHQGLGTYRIEVRGGQEDQSDYSGSASIRISRYELPQFTVSVKPIVPTTCPVRTLAWRCMEITCLASRCRTDE